MFICGPAVPGSETNVSTDPACLTKETKKDSKEAIQKCPSLSLRGMGQFPER